VGSNSETQGYTVGVAIIPWFAHPRSITTDAALNWDDRWLVI